MKIKIFITIILFFTVYISVGASIEMQNKYDTLFICKMQKLMELNIVCYYIHTNNLIPIKLIDYNVIFDNFYKKQLIILNKDTVVFGQDISRKKNKRLRTIKINNFDFNFTELIIDSNYFKFDDIYIDYTLSEYYYSNNLCVVISQPMSWCGLAGQFRFVQLIDFKKKHVYEYFINIYSCID